MACSRLFSILCAPVLASRVRQVRKAELLEPEGAPSIEVDTLCINNIAAFSMSWEVTSLRTGLQSGKSEHYPIDQTRCRDLSNLADMQIKDGDELQIKVFVDGGKDQVLSDTVVYRADVSRKASFSCRGLAHEWDCDHAVYDTVPVSKVCVDNDAAFWLSWDAMSLESGVNSSRTKKYAPGKARCRSLSKIPGIKPGHSVQVYVHALHGEKRPGTMVLKYEPNTAAWATYTCTGTTLQYSCDVLTSEPASKHIELPFQPNQCFVDKTYSNRDIQVERHIKYGANVNPYFGRGNKKDELHLDLFQAKGDKRKKRPVVVFLHSGAFLEFSNKSKFKKDDAKGVRVCMTLAKRGYVVASIDYRLVPLKSDLQKILFSAVPPRIAAEDARAAVRFMRKQAKDWHLDSDRILIAGTSAGAFASNFFAYKPDQTEGHSGSPGYSSAVNGVLSVSGSLNDRAMCLKIGKAPKYTPSFCLINGPDFTEELEPGGVPIAIIGGDKDWMVPYKDTVKMKKQADKVGIRNIFLHVPGGRHVPHLEITNKSQPFMEQWLNFVSGSLNLAEAQCPKKQQKKHNKQK